ncbi:MAG: YdcF family protein [Oscillospiraceae bacterium]|jgi:uncharacterized SAM-binding protein YcdF (DUF218 family)|nr:YdcF family protein [Oscillospiraceae bacterium]
MAYQTYEIIFNIVKFAAGLSCCGLFFCFFHKEPRRILCGILLMLALVFGVNGGLQIWRPNTYLADGSMLIGTGSEIQMNLFFVFILISFLGGAALCVNGGKLIRREGLSLAHTLPLVFGLIGMTWPVMFFGMAVIPYHAVTMQLFTVLWRSFLYVPGMLAAFLLQSLLYAAKPKPKNSDFLLVLGCGLKKDGTVTPLLAGRLDRAIRAYHADGEKATFVVSGGKGSDERNSEAFGMKQYLLGKGISEEKIILEDRSTTTAENIRFSKKLMEEAKRGYRCTIVTSNYHVLRAVILAKNQGLNAQGLGGRTKFYYLPAAFVREYIAIIFNYKKLVVLYAGYWVLLELVQHAARLNLP